MPLLALAAGGFVLSGLPADAAHRTSGDGLEPHQKGGSASARSDNRTADGLSFTASIQGRSGVGEPPNCDRSRRRLFVEGEGWIVRRVTTCY